MYKMICALDTNIGQRTKNCSVKILFKNPKSTGSSIE